MLKGLIFLEKTMELVFPGNVQNYQKYYIVHPRKFLRFMYIYQ